MKESLLLITGSTGFVGKWLCAELSRRKFLFRALVRCTDNQSKSSGSALVTSINGATDWSTSLQDVDVIIHLAARVHVMTESSKNPLDEFRKVNVEGTRRLAESAVQAGVKRFVYVSSIKVSGEGADKSYTELDRPNPLDAYGISKWEAEQVLQRISAETGLEVVIVRPPLVYGAGVKGNFAQLIKVVAKGIPLPLASVHNLRSLIYVENLVDALILCALHPNAADQTYLVSDGEDVSTSDLLRKLATTMARSERLFACSPFLLRLAGRLLGKQEQLDRLLGSLQLDSSKIRQELGWMPPFTLDGGLKATVRNIAS